MLWMWLLMIYELLLSVPPRLRRLRPRLRLVERRVAEGTRVLHVQPLSQAEPVEEVVAPRHLHMGHQNIMT